MSSARKSVLFKVIFLITAFWFGGGALAACYTDCSHLVSTAYQEAGCSSPGSTTADMYAKGEAIGNQNDLRAGDIIVYRSGGKGHAMMCENDGCGTIVHAAGQAKGIVAGQNSSWALNRNPKVLKASKYCGSCS